jgi:hypothetical protein
MSSLASPPPIRPVLHGIGLSSPRASLDRSTVGHWGCDDVERGNTRARRQRQLRVALEVGSWQGHQDGQATCRCRRSRGGMLAHVGLGNPKRVGWWDLNRGGSGATGLGRFDAV